ncbi:hypothetical protein D187_005150 [Cystobacter fuscus DSM 2262]|uniref:Uncharacterized protein n=1 Tax=Cystobacter fuscus (strain ATCC 25194 / DSM 2262 / NBRC 100088 / M29) TaxID=1242864 RepID=S9PNI0_CYSF2|nr:hypothetical protein D187_005150 [Cystobacter fuscus DSM 2262]
MEAEGSPAIGHARQTIPRGARANRREKGSGMMAFSKPSFSWIIGL